MVMEDAEAPHHLLLLRNIMSQGVVHRQPILFAAPAKDPRAFLGTLPAPVAPSNEDLSRVSGTDVEGQEQGLRIAWQYKKYFGEQPASEPHYRGVMARDRMGSSSSSNKLVTPWRFFDSLTGYRSNADLSCFKVIFI